MFAYAFDRINSVIEDNHESYNHENILFHLFLPDFDLYFDPCTFFL